MRNRTNWRKHGFTQRKPRVAGIYFVSLEEANNGRGSVPQNQRQGWDVGQIRFAAGGSDNEYCNSEEFSHWRIETLDGVDYAWRKGMWTKGPISPFEGAK